MSRGRSTWQPGTVETDPTDARSQRERMLAGDPYLPSDPELGEAGRRGLLLVERYNATSVGDPEGRRAVLTELLGSCGDDLQIRTPFHCEYGDQISFGSGCFANFGLVILDCAPVTIGDDVQIGPGVQLLTAIHPLEVEPRRAGWETAAPITIGDDVWLGGGVIVLPGVTIGAGSVIGAGAVVSRDVPPGVLALGTPARVVRSL